MGPNRDEPVVERVLDSARRSGLLESGQPAVVLLSGGRDSVCLLDVMATLIGPASVLALHVNYGLRPGAEEDERHCGELCRVLGVAFEVVRAAPGERVGNVQAWARDVRYGAARERAESRDALIAVGHTASDQVETVLYRLASSPGRRALLGMPDRDGRVIRPLLTISREQTAEYCTARGLPWREDPTNTTDQYVRGRARQRLVPALRALHPAAEANIIATAQMLRDEAEVLDALVADALEGESRIELARLGALPVPVARLVIAHLAEQARGRTVPGAGRRLEEILALGARGGTSELHVGGGVRAIVEYGVLRLAPLAPTSDPFADPGLAPVPLDVPGEARFGAWRVRCQRLDPEQARRFLSAERAGALDADAVGPALLIRPWRRGDRMRPAGLGGSRSLADLFADRRVPRHARATLPVVEREGTIAWVPGVAAAEEFRAREDTTTALALSAVLDAAP